jgi:3-isopropylmalate dehydrogenase
MFEPIGGSTPKYAGKNVINPLACIGAVQMMMDSLGETAAAGRVGAAVRYVAANEMKSMASGHMGLSTSEVGDRVAAHIADSRP